jgi:hypothetical protein
MELLAVMCLEFSEKVDDCHLSWEITSSFPKGQQEKRLGLEKVESIILIL